MATSKPRSWIRKAVRWIFAVVVAWIVLVAALVALYRAPGVHPVSTLMLRDIVLLRGYDRQWVNFEDISPALVQSVMMSEDGQFCAHGGVDWDALDSVIDDALEGERTRGASTIAMQTVKNLYLWSSRSYIRKLLEVPLAMVVDAVWSKRRTMEIYLNIAQWGPDLYGIGAASERYFGVSATKLSRRQAAYLAVALPNPIERNPAKPSSGMSRLAGIVEKRAAQSGEYIKCLDEAG
ncbi:monofunctional biosynthetic peptidoglycan transglycosylase [Hoeflea sp. WL0058]|uniref:Biosynthetic peptidoglycan transglycosylase n=1 Tax=Flavimaribacter sediminis TaxID=2865987 RepID=A0AAE2ZUE5_9HYPH|nr:monofunctional biosynthetic peptidoglycan transglycosylase [Flavimaribacter sediminis]MBW8640573.1 monofunctional biosynthetic peptidoglycan transglycosylase [Flavimaribacter sediminis]